MLGFAKWFVIFIIIGLFFAIGMRDYVIFFKIIGGFVIVKVVWSILTK